MSPSDRGEIKGKRVQLDLAPEAYAQLAKIRDRSGAKTFAEVFRSAMRLYDWYLDIRQDREKIQIVSRDGTVREVQFLL